MNKTLLDDLLLSLNGQVFGIADRPRANMFPLSKMMIMATLLVAVLLLQSRSTMGFSPVKFLVPTSSCTGTSTLRRDTQLYFFGGPKDDGSPGDYVCLVRTIAAATAVNLVSFQPL